MEQFLVAVTAALLAQAPAPAQGCQPHQAWLAALLEGYGEQPVFSSTADSGESIIIVTANPQTRTWTIGQEYAGTGVICLRLSGTGYWIETQN